MASPPAEFNKNKLKIFVIYDQNDPSRQRPIQPRSGDLFVAKTTQGGEFKPRSGDLLQFNL
jgi:hypothetical protein